MNIEDYRYITTVADTGSFTGAAKQLFIAQPSLSQRVKHVEEYYGAEFFVRDARGVRLTDAGECFVKYARRILDSEQELQKELSDMHREDVSILRIGACNLIASEVFDALFDNFQCNNPDIRCDFTQLTTPNLLKALSAGEIDVAVCYLPIIDKDLDYEMLFYDRFVLVPAEGSPLSEKAKNSPRNQDGCIDKQILAGEPFVSGKQGSRLHNYLMSLTEDMPVPPDVRYFSSNYTHMFSLAKRGIASAILYESFFDSKQEYYPYYYLDGPGNDLAVVLAWRKNAYVSKGTKSIIRAVREITQARI